MKSGSEQPGEYGGDVLDHALLGLDQPSGHDNRGHGAAGKEPLRDELLRDDPDGVEGVVQEQAEHTAAEGDEYEVDEPLAGEADEVHASTRGAPVVGDVGQTDHEPQGDGEVDAGEDQRL